MLAQCQPRSAAAISARHLCAALAAILIPSLALAAGPGAWSALYRLQVDQAPPGGDYSIAVHMAVVPAPGTSHYSRVVWWLGSNTTEPNQAGVLGWNPASEDAANYPNVVFSRLAWNPPPLTAHHDLFCSAHVQTKSGELMTLGGDDGYEWGIADAWTYRPGATTGEWTSQGTMKSRRWYGTGLVLRDGRVFVSAGHEYRHILHVGGRRDGALPIAPTAYLVDRFARPDDLSQWDLSVESIGDVSPTDRPTMPREAHTMTYLADNDFGGQVMVGGRNGNPVDDVDRVWYLKREDGIVGGTLPPEFDADYAYRWHWRTVAGAHPAPRSDHVTVGIETGTPIIDNFKPSELVVFGGRDASGPVADNQMYWHLRKDPFLGWVWSQVQLDAGSGPGPSRRYGHAACYVPSTRKMYVFGGVDQSGAITDNQLHVFTFTHSSGSAATGTWSTVTLAGGSLMPEARRDPTMVWAPGTNELLLFGGAFATATSSDAKLWRLDLDASPPSWGSVDPPPDLKPRAGHTATFDWEKTHRMFVFGGEPTNPADSRDTFVWALGVAVPPLDWQKRDDAGINLTEHAMNLDPHGEYFARIPEIFNPDANPAERWIEHPAASWKQGWYQIQYAVPGHPSEGGRVISVGWPQAYYLDVPAHGSLAGPWQPAPNGYSGMYPVTGVMYAPGKLTVAGGTLPCPSCGVLVGTTKTLDYSSGATTGWQTCAPPSGYELAPRRDHNLVLLPDGKTLAVGGTTAGNEEDSADPALAVYCPQMWDPANCQWTPLNTLACDYDNALSRPVVRNYHSVSVLLPDGRVVSAGGWPKADTPAGGAFANPHRCFARVYSPPYLFQADGVTPIAATDRPTITAAPCRIDWGSEFSIQTPAATDIAAGGKVCLIPDPRVRTWAESCAA